MLFITQYGVYIMVAAVVAQWWLGRPRQAWRHASIAAGLSFIAGLMAAQVILFFYHRIRPYDAGVSHLLLPPSADPSFPSDHAIAAFSIAFALMLQQRRQAAAAALAFAVLIGFSRIYVGMHYAGDVAGGAAVAALAALGVKAAYRPGTRLDSWLTSLL